MAVRERKIVDHMKVSQQKCLGTIKFSNKLKENRVITNSGQVTAISSSHSFPFIGYGYGLPQNNKVKSNCLITLWITDRLALQSSVMIR
jgi:hypothetical protein